MEGNNFGVSSTIYDELMLSGKHLRLCSEMEGNYFGVSSTVYDELMLSGKPPILKTDKIVMGETQ